MSPPKHERSGLAERIAEELGRELSTRTVLFHQAVADRLGLNITDHKCLDLAQRADREHPMTAGQLAELTGLTTGAITGVLDRLEKAGFIRREKAPSDRRQVLVRTLPRAEREIGQLFEPLREAWVDLCSSYDEEQLELIAGFLRKSSRLAQEAAERLRQADEASAEPAAPGELAVPLGSVSRGSLELPRGASLLTLRAGDRASLYRARTDGSGLIIEAHEGAVQVRFGRSPGLFGLGRKPAELRLNLAIPWTIVVRGGTHKLTADLRRLQIDSVEISGGASDVQLDLPRPSGTVPVVFRGGVNGLRITRPRGVAVRVVVGSGAHDLDLDTLHLGSVGGKTRWESPDFADATHRYTVDVGGGAGSLSLSIAGE